MSLTFGLAKVDRTEKVIVTMPCKVKYGMRLGCGGGELGGDFCEGGFGFGSAGGFAIDPTDEFRFCFGGGEFG